NYRNKKFRYIIRHAYTVPMYHQLYKKAGIHPSDIKTISDIQQLPIISKEIIKSYKPADLISRSSNIYDLIKVSTSGTTGKSLSIYVNMYEIILGLFGYLRTIQEYGLNWRKNRLSIIGDFAPHTAETGYVQRGILPKTWKSIYNHIQWLDTNDSPEQIIEALNKFKPDFIGGYTGMLGHLAVLKKQGKGKGISPAYIASTGALLDPHLKTFIEDVFHSTVFEVYGATETGPIAFQCKQQQIYHIMSDLLHLEFIDKQGNPVNSKQGGNLLVTKLYGGGTPIIRYDAINDIVAPLHEKHDCGLSGDLIYKIYGRESIRLYRKDGKIILASSLTEIFSRLLYELQTSKVRDMKIVQKDLETIEIGLVIDEKLKNKPPTIQEITDVFIDGFKKKFGKNITVDVNEIKRVSRDEPRIISQVDPKTITFTGYA
ncbi:MAG: hypothetical protein R6U21_06265, partial [Thermoplasmatota archaeon]